MVRQGRIRFEGAHELFKINRAVVDEGQVGAEAMLR